MKTEEEILSNALDKLEEELADITEQLLGVRATVELIKMRQKVLGAEIVRLLGEDEDAE